MTWRLADAVTGDLADALSIDPIVFCEVGARKGGEDFHGIGSFVHYVGFEPDKPQAGSLERKLTRTGVFQRVTIDDRAVMGASGTVAINVLRHPGCSSALMPDASIVSRYTTRPRDAKLWSKHFDVLGRYECASITLDEFASEAGLTRVDFLRLDTQGTEVEILLGGAEIIRRSTSLLQVEMEVLPIYQRQPLLPDVVALLASWGFRLLRLDKHEYASRAPATSDNLVDVGELISVDGLFCRELDADADPSIAAKYALLLHELGFRTFAIDSARTYSARTGTESLARLAHLMERAYLVENQRALSPGKRLRVLLRKSRLGQSASGAVARFREQKRA